MWAFSNLTINSILLDYSPFLPDWEQEDSSDYRDRSETHGIFVNAFWGAQLQGISIEAAFPQFFNLILFTNTDSYRKYPCGETNSADSPGYRNPLSTKQEQHEQ